MINGRRTMDGVARGDHPMRTPVYGAMLVATAMVGATLLVYQGQHLPGWLRASLLVLAVPVALAGWLMTFRDLSRPRSRSPRCWSRARRR